MVRPASQLYGSWADGGEWWKSWMGALKSRTDSPCSQLFNPCSQQHSHLSETPNVNAVSLSKGRWWCCDMGHCFIRKWIWLQWGPALWNLRRKKTNRKPPEILSTLDLTIQCHGWRWRWLPARHSSAAQDTLAQLLQEIQALPCLQKANRSKNAALFFYQVQCTLTPEARAALLFFLQLSPIWEAFPTAC